MVDLSSGTPWETVTLTALRRKGQNLFNDILEDAKRMAVEREEGKVVIYTNWGMEWRPFGQPRKKRPLSSVILDEVFFFFFPFLFLLLTLTSYLPPFLLLHQLIGN